MNNDKIFAELELRANTMIQALSSQRNQVQDLVVSLMGQIAILEKRLEDFTNEKEAVKVSDDKVQDV